MVTPGHHRATYVPDIPHGTGPWVPEQEPDMSIDHTTLTRGAEWAATGKITQKAPATFPAAP